MSKEVRTAQLDPDHRRDPNGAECYCVRCNKPIKADQPHRFVIVQDWSFATVIHPEDAADYDWNAEPGMFPVGMDCARKIGVEFTRTA